MFNVLNKTKQELTNCAKLNCHSVCFELMFSELIFTDTDIFSGHIDQLIVPQLDCLLFTSLFAQDLDYLLSTKQHKVAYEQSEKVKEPFTV